MGIHWNQFWLPLKQENLILTLTLPHKKNLLILQLKFFLPNLTLKTKKTLRVRCIQKVGVADFSPCYFFDEGSTIEWTPAASKLSSPAPGVKLASGPEEYFGKPTQVVEMDGAFDNIEDLAYVEGQVSNSSTKYFGELTQAMLKLADAPGSNNGTGVMQTLAAFAIRELYEKKAAAA